MKKKYNTRKHKKQSKKRTKKRYTKKGGVINEAFREQLTELVSTIPQKGHIRRYLQKVCYDGYCYGLAQYKTLVDDFFDNYSRFNYLNKFELLSEAGETGIVYKLTYDRDGYKSICILKEPIPYNRIDNLFYEAHVGEGLNILAKKCPLFLHLCTFKTPSFTYSYK
jgi:hypothetical protein